MTNKLVTVTNRFKAASSGAGASDWLSMYGESDIWLSRTPWFGGPPWVKDAPLRVYRDQSVVQDAWKVKTPIVLYVGEEDRRVPPTQAILFYRGVKAAGAPTELYIAVSGITPAPINADAPAGTARQFGDTKTQTLSVLTRIQDILKAQGAGMGDIFMMRVLLVGDPAKGGVMDFAAMNEVYAQFFGTKEQPNKVARITSQVAALAAPGMLVEVEVQAVKPKP